ncbi:MAG: NAD-dependent epimerase/dehydratase family protein [Verrucomicrobia bacterium]|nr:NAD-dependent epimerase/dehydratase family protein [Verrucomicrobiota bacterium]NBS78407.1 NAD-dependent epimerase/dehydratase family protein [bacterium]NBY66620.1 NAD-dependent epimerase/dehydratase family protein [Verrucomicrobiota bacterium]
MTSGVDDHLFQHRGHMIVVTGGTGFVGREICRALRAEGLAVRALARTPSADLPSDVEFFPADITQPASLRHAFKNAQAVIHTVGIIREHGPQTFSRVHLQGTADVVAAARAAAVPRLLHISALGTRPHAASRYHQTKWGAEEIVRTSGLAATIFRPSLIYGKGDASTTQLAKLLRPPFSWLLGGFLPLPGGSDVTLCPVAVTAVAETVVRSLGQAPAVGQTFDLCGPSTTLRDLALEIARVLGLQPTWVQNSPDVIFATLPWLWFTRKKPVLFPVPLGLCRLAAALAERLLPCPPLTTDQILMLEEGQVGDSQPARQLLGFHTPPLGHGLASYLAPRAGGAADRRS